MCEASVVEVVPFSASDFQLTARVAQPMFDNSPSSKLTFGWGRFNEIIVFLQQGLNPSGLLGLGSLLLFGSLSFELGLE